MSSNPRKRLKVCNCKVCNGKLVPQSTASRHKSNQEYEESCQKTFAATSDASHRYEGL